MSTWLHAGSVDGRCNWKPIVVSATGPNSTNAESTSAIGAPPDLRATNSRPCTQPRASRAWTRTGTVLPTIRISLDGVDRSSTSNATSLANTGGVGRPTSLHAARKQQVARSNGVRGFIGAPGGGHPRSRQDIAAPDAVPA